MAKGRVRKREDRKTRERERVKETDGESAIGAEILRERQKES